jgi:hypothetical protein
MIRRRSSTTQQLGIAERRRTLETHARELAQCRLCGQSAELRSSHIVPAFVFKWIKETSATGFLRFGQEPNKREQDGYRDDLLCASCEGRLNQWETRFANEIFYPLMNDGGKRVPYGDWLLKFCVSVSWRVLLMMQKNNLLGHLSADQIAAAQSALDRWSMFLLDQTPHPGSFQQHFLPLDALEETSKFKAPPNFNRYILRTVHIDVVRGETTAFVYSKLGKLIIIGFIELNKPNAWIGSKVHVRNGVVAPQSFTVPSQFGGYLKTASEGFATVYNEISDVQREKIDVAMWNNIPRVLGSGSVGAMTLDVKMSGHAAFDIHSRKKEG